MIIPMKKANIVIMKDDYDKVIKSLQKHEVIMIINNEDGVANIDYELNNSLKERVEKVIKMANKYNKKKPLFSYKEVNYNDFINVKDETINEISKIEEIEDKISDLNQLNIELNNEYKKYLDWYNLDINLSDIKQTKYTKSLCFSVALRNLEKVTKYLDDSEELEYVKVNCANGLGYYFITYLKDRESIILDELKEFDINITSLPNENLFMKDYLDLIDEKIKSNVDNIKSLESSLIEYSKKVNNYELLSDQILSLNEINDLHLLNTSNTVLIEGWVRSDSIDLLQKSLDNVTNVYDLELTDPNEVDVVPTYTKNNKFVSQFETITDMFSKPNNKEVDPNPVMSIWYWVLFGMMMGDSGYGLMMIVFGLLFKKITKPKGNTLKLVNVITYSGIPTIFWGILFGSFFGYNPKVDFGISWFPYWFTPMEGNGPITLLVLSVALGALHIISGLIIKAYSDLKNKKIQMFLGKDLSWIFTLVGLGMYILKLVGLEFSFVDTVSKVGLIICLTGVGLIILFNGWEKKNVLSRAFSGIIGLYDATSYMSDLLSYSRIMALAMSSAAVAMVMNTLSKMVSGGPIGIVISGIVFIIGHCFNLVLGLLSAYVHDSRLQYIEFFGKFFEGSGVDFKPLSVKTKYINNIKNQ